MKPTKMKVIKAYDGYNHKGQIIDQLYEVGSYSKCYNASNGYYYLMPTKNLVPAELPN